MSKVNERVSAECIGARVTELMNRGYEIFSAIPVVFQADPTTPNTFTVTEYVLIASLPYGFAEWGEELAEQHRRHDA